MERRTYLATVGSTVTALTVGVAGCEGAPGGGVNATETTEEADDGALDGETTETTDDGDSDGTADGDTPDGTATGTNGGGTTVDMVTEDSEYYFDPIGLHVEPGSTVTWNNVAGSHTSTAYAESLDAAETTRIPEDAEPWDSGILSEEGATFEHTVEVEGTYDYFCIPHKQLGMVGRLVVGEPGGPATDGQPPDGEVPSSEDIVDQGSISYDDFSG